MRRYYTSKNNYENVHGYTIRHAEQSTISANVTTSIVIKIEGFQVIKDLIYYTTTITI